MSRYLLSSSAAGCALAVVVLLWPGAAGAKGPIFELEDPRGDDHGNGRLVYPLRSDFQEGDLDLLSLSARSVSGGTRFRAVFAKPVRVPLRESVDGLGTSLSAVARHGFYTFNLDVYIDVDRELDSGARAMLPGRLAEVAGEHAWDRAIVLTPQPNEARGALRRLVLRTMKQEVFTDQEEEVDEEWLEEMRRTLPANLDERVFFPTRITVRGRMIDFTVPDSFLGGKADPAWSYVVVVSGSDLLQRIDMSAAAGTRGLFEKNLGVLAVTNGTVQNLFGGGMPDQRLQPPLIDIIVPPGERQEALLSDFSSREGRPARLPGVVPAQGGR